MILSITGHRAPKIELYNKGYIKTQLKNAFNDLDAEIVIQGMCDGVDLMAAWYAYEEHIPFWAVRPWAGHTAPAGWRDLYLSARVYADKVITLDKSEDYPGPWAYHARNRWMVDNSDVLVAVWNGDTEGGTYQTIKYAKDKRQIWRIDPVNYKSGWL